MMMDKTVLIVGHSRRIETTTMPHTEQNKPVFVKKGFANPKSANVYKAKCVNNFSRVIVRRDLNGGYQVSCFND